MDGAGPIARWSRGAGADFSELRGSGRSSSSSSSLRLIEVLLEAGEGPADVLGSSQIRHGVGDGVVILQPQQRRELLLVELFHAHADVVRQHEIEKDLLLLAEVRADVELGPRGALLTGASA